VSQVVVLPPFQRKGYGGKMLRAVYKHAQSDNRILDVSVEDPSPDFQVSLFQEHRLYTKNCTIQSEGERERERGGREGGREGDKIKMHLIFWTRTQSHVF
jgi:GNAT superfamily N-acetyltransferase